MGTKIQLYLIHKRLLNMVSYVNVLAVLSSVFGFLGRVLFHVICFITRYLIRLLEKSEEKRQRVDDRCFDNGETRRGQKEGKDCDDSETRSSMLFSSSAKKYEVFAVKDINGFIEEPKAVSFTVRELYLGSDEEIHGPAMETSSDEDEGFASPAMESEIFEAEEEEYWKSKFEFFTGEMKDSVMIDESFSGWEELVIEKESESGVEEEASEIGNRNSSFEINDSVSGSEELVIKPREGDETENFCNHDSSLVGKISNHDSSFEIDKFGVFDVSFLGSNEIPVELQERDEIEDFGIIEKESQLLNIEEVEIAEIGNRDSPSIIDESHPLKNNPDLFGVSEDSLSSSKETIEEEVIEIDNLDSSSKIDCSNSIQHDIQDKNPRIEENVVESGDHNKCSKLNDYYLTENRHHTGEHPPYVLKQESEFQDKCAEIKLKTSCAEFWGRETKEEQIMGEFEWEHEDVIEQLKLELKRARAGGLSTIMEEEDEESSPEIGLVKLRPVKIEFKFGYKERIEELQKVYKIYADRMRKLDILNNQTMHALGFLQLKDQSKSTLPKQKPTMTAKSFLPRLSHRQNEASFPLKHDVKLQNDFEFVYVGQVCLSWEILRWQHGRLRDLLQNDNAQPRRLFRHVASEFQLFQVLVHRFVEDESYRGPRVQNYVKNRCVLRSLIQVPMIRDDSAKDKHYVSDEKEELVSCETLEKTVLDSMLTFWEFVRKDEKSIDSQHSVIEPGDTRLLVEIRKEFHKKERKVKDIERSGNCVAKKLQKKQGQNGMEGHEMLLALVELRLVSRVLGMSRLSRDHLLWCQHKLNQITFLNKKIHFETSFLLFPC